VQNFRRGDEKNSLRSFRDPQRLSQKNNAGDNYENQRFTKVKPTVPRHRPGAQLERKVPERKKNSLTRRKKYLSLIAAGTLAVKFYPLLLPMKISVPLRAPRLVALLALAFATLSASNLSAQTVNTIPVGAVTVSIAAGTGSTRALSTVSFPLIETATAAGQMIGSISSVTPNTITNASAGWTPSQLSTAATPHVIQITSGAASGRTFLVSVSVANTATTLTLDADEANAAGTGLVNLSSLGISAGDTYRIIACDTINSLFGGPAQSGILANASSANADTIQVLVSGVYRTYFHNTTQWVRAGLNTPSNNVAIRPDAMLIVNRLGNTPLSLTVTGEVPSEDRKATVRNSGLTTLSTSFPVNYTLLSSGIQSMPGWVSSANPTIADNVSVLFGTTYRNYYFDGTQWRRVGLNTPSNGVAINAATGVVINKKGAVAGSSALSQVLPYTL
jgi:hypothetical protein